NEPAAMPVASPKVTGPAAGRYGAILFGIGCGVGLTLGVVLTLGASATYTFFTQTVPSTRDSVQVFNELNELRQQINQLNEETKLKDQEKEEALRQSLGAVASTVRAPDSGTAGADSPAPKEGGGAEKPPVAKSHDPFAEIDDEIKRLEQAQKVLNSILDMFSKGKEGAKDR